MSPIYRQSEADRSGGMVGKVQLDHLVSVNINNLHRYTGNLSYYIYDSRFVSNNKKYFIDLKKLYILNLVIS